MSDSTIKSLLQRQREIETLSPAARNLEQRDIDLQATLIEGELQELHRVVAQLRVDLGAEQQKADKLQTELERYRNQGAGAPPLEIRDVGHGQEVRT